MADRGQGGLLTVAKDQRLWKKASEISNEDKERGCRLKLIRLGLHKMPSQRQFAERLGATTAQYSNWERGWPIPQDYVKRILDKTPEIDADWLLWGYTRPGISSETLRLLEAKSMPTRIDKKRFVQIKKACIEAYEKGGAAVETVNSAIRAVVPEPTSEEISAVVKELAEEGERGLWLSRLLKKKEEKS